MCFKIYLHRIYILKLIMNVKVNCDLSDNEHLKAAAVTGQLSFRDERRDCFQNQLGQAKRN